MKEVKVYTLCEELNLKIILYLLVLMTAIGCANNKNTNRTSFITSIGNENLTLKKNINIIVHSNDDGNEALLKKGAQLIFRELGLFKEQNKIQLNKVATHKGSWMDIADNIFDSAEYNWVIRVDNYGFPSLAFQNFSDDIDSSREVHFRYCQERVIQFSHLDLDRFQENREFWLTEIYPAAIEALYLLMKGNVNLEPIAIKNYSGRALTGTLLGENKNYRFALDGETFIYIIPKYLTDDHD